jgi:hypothetical protein
METDKIKNDISSRYEYLKNNKVILGFLSEKISLVLNNRLHPRYIETEEFIKILSDGKNNFKNNMSTFFESIDEM